ncbi:MAG: hypothetical protein ACYCQJ_12665 [Nitrososphaerales archaeon]
MDSYSPLKRFRLSRLEAVQELYKGSLQELLDISFKTSWEEVRSDIIEGEDGNFLQQLYNHYDEMPIQAQLVFDLFLVFEKINMEKDVPQPELEAFLRKFGLDMEDKMIIPNDPLQLYNEHLETFTLVIKDMGILTRECRELNLTPAEFIEAYMPFLKLFDEIIWATLKLNADELEVVLARYRKG